jgi:predicted CopG family antitoxin
MRLKSTGQKNFRNIAIEEKVYTKLQDMKTGGKSTFSEVIGTMICKIEGEE